MNLFIKSVLKKTWIDLSFLVAIMSLAVLGSHGFRNYFVFILLISLSYVVFFCSRIYWRQKKQG